MIGNQSRRAFLQRASVLGAAGAAAPFVTQLAGIGEAAAATSSDYKALVCIFLYGGNDYANTLTPYDQASYNQYRAARSAVAHARESLAGTLLQPSAALPDGRQFAMAPALAPLLPLFDAGKLAPVLNLGTLAQPTSKAQYRSGTHPLPPKLFSHNDQSSFWQAGSPEGSPSGWGGRMGDLFQSGNGSATLTCINTAGNAVYLAGRTATQYSMGVRGPNPLLGGANSVCGSTQVASTLRSLMGAGSTNLIQNEYAKVTKRSLDTFTQVSTALNGAPVSGFNRFADTTLGSQLQTVARMISVAQELGARRQVFFVSMGGFDMHDGLLDRHAKAWGEVAGAMRAFYDTTVALGVADKVTSFTGSDFGRTLTCNSDGSDHGWGSHHFVMGGAVKGGRFYGRAPLIGSDTDDDVGQGRLLPSTSVDQYAVTLASWFGVGAGDMATVLPAIGNYDRSTWNLGFV